MVVVDRQVHGYRQGHQLLAASLQLPKADQSVLDTLSDVAGPLRPREKFEPYLTAYPLPSGERYVLAKTWQDTTVSRAGCVRTLSVIIGLEDWSLAENLSPFLELLRTNTLPKEEDATQQATQPLSARPLSPISKFGAGELLEALFLEEPRPVVVFDAPTPDLVALRILTALWPSMRQKFALSTFALSPRKIEGRDFDLVFAPKDAKGKFSDWNGRRIDGRSGQDARHRWTSAIVNRVFTQKHPQLLTASELDLVGGNDADNAAALRIALLWDELSSKLDRTPTAALGLLDIANSGKVRDKRAVKLLEPGLARAIERASADLPIADAWDFLGAINTKMRARAMPLGKSAVGLAAEKLAARAPEGAVALLAKPELEGGSIDLLPRIARGLGEASAEQSERALMTAQPELLLQLVAAEGRLTERAAANATLVERIGEALNSQGSGLVEALHARLLPLLVQDWQLSAAGPLVMTLDGPGLASEITHLGTTNDFEASSLSELVIERAQAVGAKLEVRASILAVPPSQQRNALLAKTLDPIVDDVAWVLETPELSSDLAFDLLTYLIRRADDSQLSAILNHRRVSAGVIARIQYGAAELLERALYLDDLGVGAFVAVTNTLLGKADHSTRVGIAVQALRYCLSLHLDGDEVSFIENMLGVVGDELDGEWVVRIGLGRNVPTSIASRNMVAFRNAVQPARLRIVWSISDLAQILSDRRIDLDATAVEACAHLMLEAEKVVPTALLSAAGRLLPILMRQRREPVSLMIAAAFPAIYRELAKEVDVPDLLKFIPFVDWDRCKTARHELVSAFISSSWSPTDLALTAWRCGDVDKILRRTIRSYGGEGYIDRIAREIDRLPDECRPSVERAISNIKSKSNSSVRYDWRD